MLTQQPSLILKTDEHPLLWYLYLNKNIINTNYEFYSNFQIFRINLMQTIKS